MKIKYIITLTIIVISLFSCKQDETKRHKEIYEKALKVSDYNTAINAAYNIISLNENDSSFVDSLVFNYYRMGYYPAVYKLGGELLVKSPTNTKLLEAVIDATIQLDYNEEAILYLQALQEMKPQDSTKIYYKLGEQYFKVKNYAQCGSLMQRVLKAEDSQKQTDVVVTENRKLEIPYYVLAQNTMGVLAMIQQRYDIAESIYREILTAYPDFELAQNNYRFLQRLTEKEALSK